MMTIVKITNKLKRLAYRCSDFDIYFVLTFGLVIITVKNTFSDDVRYMIETNNLIFYVILSTIAFWWFSLMVSSIWGVLDIEKRAKELGIAVIK